MPVIPYLVAIVNQLCGNLTSFTDCRKLYQCEECGQICMTTSFLKKHKRIHSKERPYKCPVCNAAFKDKSYLKRHSVTHTGVKEFKCDVCDKEFSHQREYCHISTMQNDRCQSYSNTFEGIKPEKSADGNNFTERIVTS